MKQLTVVEHELKTHPPYFAKVYYGEKPFEIRLNDRDFQRGDILILKEYDPECDKVHARGEPDPCYTGRWVRAEVTYMTDFEQQNGYVVMGIKMIERNGLRTS